MGRNSWIRTGGLLAFVTIVGTGTVAGMEGSDVRRVVPPGDVVFSARPLPDGGSVLVVDSPGVRFEKALYADRLVVTLVGDADRVTIRADAAGAIAVTRGGTTKLLSAATISARDLAATRALLAGSDAAAAFRVLAGRLETDESPMAESVVVTGALVAVLDGDGGAPRRLGQWLLRKHGVRLRQVAGQKTAGECWDVYAREAMRIAADAEDCGSRYWWNPVWQAACGAQFVIRAELNWFWLISCSGGVPT